MNEYLEDWGGCLFVGLFLLGMFISFCFFVWLFSI